MNFLGHAAVARWVSADPRFVLGAMLPDLAHMAGIRGLQPDDAAVAAGIAFHHRTDAAFHGCASFHALSHAGSERLQHEGVARGPALAVGHIAIELLLDGTLADDRELVADYLGALRAEVAIDDSIDHLRTRLADAGAPSWYLDLDELAVRLERILARRPRLALQPSDREPVRAWLYEARDAVVADVDSILAELRVRLSDT